MLALAPPEKTPIATGLINKDWFWGLFLFIITFLAYHPAWNGSQIWDDDYHITKPELRSIEGLGRIWTHLGATQQYYPLVHSVFWLEYRLWGDSTLGYHLLNILLHLLSAFLLVKILRFLQIPGAWLAGAIFALHPIQVESVAWISELKNTLSGAFFLSAAFMYLRFDRERKKKLYAIALGLFIFGLMSKSVIATLPVSLIMVLWWKRGKIDWKPDIAPLIPFFIIGIASGLFTAWVEQRFILGPEGSNYDFSIIERCLIAGRVVWFYIAKLFWPVDLIFIYPRWNISQAVWWQYLFPIAALILAGMLFILRNRWRAPLAIFVYFTATLFPALGFFNVYPFQFSFVADHFQYLACISSIVMVVAGMDRALGSIKKGKNFLKRAGIVILLFTLSTLTWKQSRMYSDATVLFRSVIKKNSACWMAYNNLGILLMNSGQKNEGIGYFKKALEINPNYIRAYCNLGNALFQSGQTNAANAQFQKALEINPHNAGVRITLGNVLLQNGQNNAALAQFQKALEINPNNPEVYNIIGYLLEKNGRFDEAIAHYRKALEINPKYGDAYYNLGAILLNTGQTEDAIVQFRKVLEIKPRDGNAYNNLGNALMKIGQTDEAIACYRNALEINPNKINTLKNLSAAFAQKGKLADAIIVLQRALEVAKFKGQEKLAVDIAADLENLNQANRSIQGKLR
jgi:protein O-mannosyl-transferase